MKFKDSSNFKLSAAEFRSEQDLIKYVSIEIWNRIKFVFAYTTQKQFMKIYEVTLTQNMIYELFKFNKEHNINLVNLYESVDESANGADILVCIEFDRGTLKFPFQCKLLKTSKSKQDGVYKSFWHNNTNGLQIDLLNKYADDLGSKLGFFLLYNYIEETTKIKKSETELYGCSYAPTNIIPNSLSQKSSIKFSDLHPNYAHPFFHFFDRRTDNDSNENDVNGPTPASTTFDDVKDFFRKYDLDIDDSFISKLTFYSEEDMANDSDNWNEFNEEVKTPQTTSQNYSNDFNPKFRMILVKNPTIQNEEEMLTKNAPSEKKFQNIHELEPQ